MSGNKRVSRRFTRGAVIPAAVAWMGLVGASVGLMQAVCIPSTVTPEALVANAGADATVAVGSTVALVGSATGGTAPYTYLWQQTAGVTQALSNADRATASVSGVAAGTATFQLTVTDATGATATDTVVITVSAASSDFSVSAGADQTATGGATVTLTGTATNGVSPIGWSWLLASSGTAGSVVLTNSTSQTAQATFTADATGDFTFQVTATDAASASATDTVVVTLTAAPSTLAFTLNTDDRTGTAGDDTFTAAAAWDSGLQYDTLQTGDQAAGGDGADVLNCTFAQLAAGNPVVTLGSIETLNFTAFVANALDATAWTGVTDINLVNGSAALVVTSLPDLADLGITNTAGGLTVQIDNDAVTAADDAIALTLDRANGNAVLVNSTGTDGVETINVASGGTADNELASLDSQDSVAADVLETVNVSGDQALEITTALAATVETLDASASTGGVTVAFTAGADVTATGGTGDDSLDLSGGYDDNDTIDGGDGTDTLGLLSAEAAVAADQTNVTNVEGLMVTDAIADDIDVSYFGSVTEVIASAGFDSGADRTLTVPTGTAITIEADTAGGAATSHIIQIDDDSSADTIDLTMVDADFAEALDLIDVEVCNLAAEDDATTFTDLEIDPSAAQDGLLNITGDQDVTLTSATLDEIDATALTGDLTVTVTGATQVNGGEGDDTITGSASDDALAGNAGDDTIDGAAGEDNINGGDDDDSITGGADDDVLAGGDGVDTFVFEADGATNGEDVISDFTEDDVLDFTTNGFTGEDAPAGTVADDSTDDEVFADGDIWIVTDDDGSTDTSAEVQALFGGAGDVFEAIPANDTVVLLIQDTQSGGSTAIWFLDDANGNSDFADANECLQVGTLDGFNGTIGDDQILD